MSTIWRHKDIWSANGVGFLVQVSHHTGEPSSFNYEDEGHRWCVYAYIYPTHPRFAAFSGPSMFQDAACALQLHGGPSLLRWHYEDDGKPCSVQVGADYNHLHDTWFTQCSTEQEASEVFEDAQRLFEYLSAKGEQA